MNRRKFALSWGRKLFFGISWPLSMLLGLVYLRSAIIPESTNDWIYFVTTFIGYFGLLNALAYFVIYAPLVSLMPSYYISRLVSVILILALNLFIAIDAITYAHYHHHIYGFLSQLIIEKGIQNFLGSAALVIISVALLVLGILIWIRGEMIWRGMQARFSNPVKSWYLVVIVLFLLIGKAVFFYGDLNPKLGTLLPFDMNFSKSEESKYAESRKIYYPKDDLFCQSKTNPNIVFITLREWSIEELNPDTMPSVFHMKKHAISYNRNYGVSLSPAGGKFSLLYSIPSSYAVSAKSIEPAINSELAKRRYEVAKFETQGNGSPQELDDNVMKQFRQWIQGNTGEEISPKYFSFSFRQHSSEVDKNIKEIILTLQKEGLLNGTHLVVTGEYQGENNELIPLLYFDPSRTSSEVNYATSQYDIVPSLMQKVWGCKNAHKVASVGEPLETTNRDWLLMTGDEGFRIIDFNNNNVTSVFSNRITDHALSSDKASEPQHDLILSALKMMASFHKFK